MIVTHLGRNQYQVTNERQRVYYVDLDEAHQRCDCPRGCYSDHPVPCRHVKAVLAYRSAKPLEGRSNSGKPGILP